MLSDCLSNVRIDTNGENYSEFNHRSENHFEDANRCVGQELQQQKSSPGSMQFDKDLFQSKKRFDLPTTRCSPPRTDVDLNSPGEYARDDYNFESRVMRQESPAQHDSDFDRECIDSYQKWRAKNAALFATPENAAHNVPEQTVSQKILSNHHDARDDFKLKDHSQSPEKSTLDKYYEYFKRDKNPKQYDTGDFTKGVAIYSEKSVSHHKPHQIISSREGRVHYDPKFCFSDELEANRYHKNKPSSYRNQYQSEEFIHEKKYLHGEKIRKGYDLCCDSHRCKQERFRVDEDYVNGSPLLRRRHFEDEEEARGMINRAIEEDFNRHKKDGCSKNSGSRKKLKKSPPMLKSRGRKRNCSCPECDDDENIEESHCDLVKYKTSKNSSQSCRKEVDEKISN
ncbi:hypothetical protein LSTR_LSTR014584 [Laodelphax striatellus]|uniref:Uncharacterized protein n=1 Tax=Laodelphax striatellus TaxID=195883 RepID=A0A482XES9_LAOST|nr:hypothetical protein LSTR_LSTR014584 [Laodelphax striatellus]